MKTRLKLCFTLIFLIIAYNCQDNLDESNLKEESFSFLKTKQVIFSLSEKIHHLTLRKANSSIVLENEQLIKVIGNFKNRLPILELKQIATPFLPPNGKSEKDIFFRNTFFDILNIQEILREILECYNKFIIQYNLKVLSKSSLLYESENLLNLLKLRHAVIQKINIVNNEIIEYNNKINTYFEKVCVRHKMAGYYSFDNSHFRFVRDQFTPEDINILSFNYRHQIISKGILRSKNIRSKLYKPIRGAIKGTIFVSRKNKQMREIIKKQNIKYPLKSVLNMTIDYCTNGKLYYYKGLNY